MAAKVLVVDDDPATLRLVEVILRLDDFEVATAAGGTLALELIREESPDLVILDLSMPDMDGRQVYVEARAFGYDAPMLICSAYGSARAARDLGASASLDKPFEPDLLIEMVQGLISMGPDLRDPLRAT